MKIKKALLSARAGAEGLLGLGQYVQRHRRGSSADRRGAGLMPAALYTIAAILYSTGAQCKHVNHVMTQIPYALVAGGFSLVLYLILGFVF